MQIDIKYLNDKCRLEKGSDGAIAYDFRANITGPITIKCGHMAMVPLGFKVDTKEASVGMFLFIRSGMAAKHGLTLMNAVGVIDSDYRGEVKACIYNTGITGEDFVINPYDRCGQLIFLSAVDVQLNEVTELEESKRGTGGFGSTGV